MPKEKMISGNWWGEVKKKASPKYIEWDANPIEVVVDFDKDLHKKLDDDPLLLQKLSDGGSAEYKKFIDNAAKKVKETEAELEKLSKEFEKNKDIVEFNKKWDAIQQKFIKDIRTEAEAAEANIEKGIMDAFAKYQKTKKDYKGYKIRAGIKLGLKFAALGFAIAKLVGTSGADLLAWRTVVRDSIKSVTEITKLCQSAETFRKATEKQLKVVLAWQAKLGDGKGVTAAETGLGLLKVVIGTDCEMSIDAVGANVKQFRSKLKGVELSAHSVAKQLQLALNRMDSVKKEVPADIASQMEELETQVRELIAEIGSLMGEVSRGLDWADTVEKIVTDIKKAKSITHLSKLVKALESAADIASSINGWVEFADKGDKLAVRIAKQTVVVGKNMDRWYDDVKKLAS